MEPGSKVRMSEMTFPFSALLTQSDKEQLFGLQKMAESASVSIADSRFKSHATQSLCLENQGHLGDQQKMRPRCFQILKEQVRHNVLSSAET